MKIRYIHTINGKRVRVDRYVGLKQFIIDLDDSLIGHKDSFKFKGMLYPSVFMQSKNANVGGEPEHHIAYIKVFKKRNFFMKTPFVIFKIKIFQSSGDADKVVSYHYYIDDEKNQIDFIAKKLKQKKWNLKKTNNGGVFEWGV